MYCIYIIVLSLGMMSMCSAADDTNHSHRRVASLIMSRTVAAPKPVPVRRRTRLNIFLIEDDGDSDLPENPPRIAQGGTPMFQTTQPAILKGESPTDEAEFHDSGEDASSEASSRPDAEGADNEDEKKQESPTHRLRRLQQKDRTSSQLRLDT